MNKDQIVLNAGIVLMGAAALVFAGCIGEDIGDEDLAEDVGQAEQGLGTECAAAAATDTFTGTIDYDSPQTYSTTYCYKGVALDVNNYSMPAPGPGQTYGYTRVSWNDTVPTTQAACESAVITVYLFEVLGGTPTYVLDKQDFGNWNSSTSTCLPPSVYLEHNEMLNGDDWRVAAGARTEWSSSAATRKLRVRTIGPQSP